MARNLKEALEDAETLINDIEHNIKLIIDDLEDCDAEDSKDYLLYVIGKSVNTLKNILNNLGG